MAPVDLRHLEDLYEAQHSGRYRADPALTAAVELIDSAPGVIRETRALRRVASAASRVSDALVARGVSFPALEDLNDALAVARGETA